MSEVSWDHVYFLSSFSLCNIIATEQKNPTGNQPVHHRQGAQITVSVITFGSSLMGQHTVTQCKKEGQAEQYLLS